MALAAHDLVAAYPAATRRALDSDFVRSPRVDAGGRRALGRRQDDAVAHHRRPSASSQRRRAARRRLIASLPPQQRRIALVFQDDALFYNMTVRANLRFALRDRTDARRARCRNGDALHVGDLLDRRPRELSGGERQRASIARALLSDPPALLLDEPLAHLDPSLRRTVRDEIVGLHERFAGPVLYVTHDHAEAMSVGDRLAVLIDGRIEDVGEPQRVYDSPRNSAVARFLGDRPMNLLPKTTARSPGIRPERVRVAPDAALRGRVARRERPAPTPTLWSRRTRGAIIARVPGDDRGATRRRVALDLPADSCATLIAHGAALRMNEIDALARGVMLTGIRRPNSIRPCRSSADTFFSTTPGAPIAAVRALTDALRAMRDDRAADRDRPGGRPRRALARGVEPMPSMMALGAAADLELASAPASRSPSICAAPAARWISRRCSIWRSIRATP